MTYLLQQLPTLATVGSLYALAAAGYTLIHAVTRQFNLAAGAFYILGAYAAFIAATLLDILGAVLGVVLFAAAFAAGTVVAGAAGIASLPLTGSRRPVRANPVAPLVTTIGLWIATAESVRLLHESHIVFLFNPVPGSITVLSGADIVMPLRQVWVMPTIVLALGGLIWLHRRTSAGRMLRAVADDPAMAPLLGISVTRTVAIGCALGAALLGLAGALAVLRYGAAWPYMGLLFGLKAIAAAAIGGIGSIGGAIGGGALIAALETLWSAYLPGDYRDVVVLALLAITLIFRPDGLFVRPALDTAPGAGAARRSASPG